jgi:hypothetical protein
LLQFDRGESEPNISVEFTRLLMDVPREIEDYPPSISKDAIRGLRGFLRTRGMMKRLAGQRQINAFGSHCASCAREISWIDDGVPDFRDLPVGVALLIAEFLRTDTAIRLFTRPANCP